jgi:methionine aminopeptidase
MITRKKPEQVALMRRAGKVVAEMHEVCIRAARPGARCTLRPTAFWCA